MNKLNNLELIPLNLKDITQYPAMHFDYLCDLLITKHGLETARATLQATLNQIKQLIKEEEQRIKK